MASEKVISKGRQRGSPRDRRSCEIYEVDRRRERSDDLILSA